ncbi:hypothetical protein [Kineosporia sp. A_224]|uniref:hypothetical protein n=1 Tax=Kineosporia sp. A_224 TaxID=1962180 RepID=UPI00117A8EAC|nr:hypothetical protein [Kineosporia sp. A_224]
MTGFSSTPMSSGRHERGRTWSALPDLPRSDARRAGAVTAGAGTATGGPRGPRHTPAAIERPRVVVRVPDAHAWSSGDRLVEVRGFAHAWTADQVFVHLMNGYLGWVSAQDVRLPDALD